MYVGLEVKARDGLWGVGSGGGGGVNFLHRRACADARTEKAQGT